MKGLQIRSIQMKIALWAGCCLMLVTVILIGYGVWRLRTQAMDAAQMSAIALGEAKAAQIEAEVELAMDAARTMAQALSAAKSQNLDLTRDQVNGILRGLTSDNPNFIGTWTIWEPDAFDGRDAEYVNVPPYDETGRFIAYWNRDDTGNIQVETPQDYQIEGPGDYYQIPKRKQEETITEPYLYPVQGKEVLMTSIVVPIMVEGTFHGVAGVDMALDFFQAHAEDIDAYEGTAQMILISHEGTFVGSTGNPDIVGRHLSEITQDAEAYSDYLQRMQTSYDENQDSDSVSVFVPIQFGQTTTPWSVSISIPTAQINAEATAVMWQMIGIGVVLAFATLALLWFVSRLIANPITQITHLAQMIAQGNLDQKVDITSSDEVGQLANAFQQMIGYLQNMAGAATAIAQGDLTATIVPQSEQDTLGNAVAQMIANLRNLVGQVINSANNVSTAAGQLTTSADQSAQAANQVAGTIQQVASGTSQQTRSVTQATSTVEQMARAIDGVARGAQEQASAVGRSAEISARISTAVQQVFTNAQAGAQSAAEASRAAYTGATTVEKTVKGMENIKDKVNLSAQRVREMGQHSDQIGAIVETIDDIASQTNLLALNAAIEAARAGEHGKGFAVVADEVRKLAESAASSTKEISNLIKEVQYTVTEAVQAMDEGATEVEAGVAQADEAGQALHAILVAAESVNRQVEDIASAAQQMDASANELVSAMDTVSAVVEENTAATEEMAAGASEVSHAIENIASISEENSAASEEVSATVEEVSAQVEEVTALAQSLDDMAQHLRGLVAQFKLPDTLRL